MRISRAENFNENIKIGKEAYQSLSRYYRGLVLIRPQIEELLNGPKSVQKEFYTCMHYQISEIMDIVDAILDGTVYLRPERV